MHIQIIKEVRNNMRSRTVHTTYSASDSNNTFGKYYVLTDKEYKFSIYRQFKSNQLKLNI